MTVDEINIDALPKSVYTNNVIGIEKFLGQKERRRSSLTKLHLGDYLNLIGEPSIKKLMAKNGDFTISFADIVIKVNRKNKMQERVLLITDKALYNIDPSGYKVKRRIPLEIIGDIKLSKLPDNFFCIGIPAEYDYLLESSKKTEIITKIVDNYEKLLGKPITVTFSDSFSYFIEKDVAREIHFHAVQGGVSTQIFSKSKKSK